LEIRSIPGVFVHLIPTLIRDDNYSTLALARDFDHLAKKRAKYTVSAHPFLSDRKASHVCPPVRIYCVLSFPSERYEYGNVSTFVRQSLIRYVAWMTMQIHEKQRGRGVRNSPADLAPV
jgi:hypothetical protein